jgi:glycosyltransferase involved in cell wall biosynthesis
VQADDKAALMAGAALLVLPSYSENFGNVVIEAMAAGRPVIVTREVGAAEAVADAQAGLVVDGDSGELAAALTRLLSRPALREERGARGRAAARERFAWPAVAARMEAMYASLLSGGDGRH